MQTNPSQHGSEPGPQSRIGVLVQGPSVVGSSVVEGSLVVEGSFVVEGPPVEASEHSKTVLKLVAHTSLSFKVVVTSSLTLHKVPLGFILYSNASHCGFARHISAHSSTDCTV